MFIFFCTSIFFSLILLQPQTVKLYVTKSYILVDVVGVLAVMYVVRIFMRGGHKSDIMNFLFYHELK